MKTFEEKYTAWIDGELHGPELAEFEKELGPEAAAEKQSTAQLGSLLREHFRAPSLANADFFNHSLLDQIRAAAPPASARRTWWTLPRMAWAGACCALLAAAIALLTIPQTPKRVPTEAEYLAEVIESKPGDPSISATAFHSKSQNVSVLWLSGLEYVPDEHEL